eukprot:scaffold99331_cov63-Phaeocystis_antarctica.AAC.1
MACLAWRSAPQRESGAGGEEGSGAEGRTITLVRVHYKGPLFHPACKFSAASLPRQRRGRLVYARGEVALTLCAPHVNF